MGVPKFYRWISERYPCLSEVVKEYQVPEFDNLYLDMNGIIHVCSHPNDDDPHFRISEEQIFKDIFHYIEVLFRIIRPRKVFFMAVDGVAPRAKMNQQRGRRFRSAKEAEENIKKALKKGEKLPDEKRFDSNCITPGTKFMVRLQEQLKYMVQSKVTTDPAWQGIRIYLSGHETPGEGEHKITEFIRYERTQPGYDPNTRHCLYGLDADLMMLGLCSHEPHFSLLREEVRFTGKKKKNARTPKAEETTFHLLHLSLMREYIDHEFGSIKNKIPFKYDLESIIDDWVLMGFLVGNDFIPHLPHLHIAHNALPMLYKTYMSVLPTLDGYLNEDGIVNLPRFEKYLQALSKFDTEKFDEQFADLKWLESKTGKSRSKAKSSQGSKVESSSNSNCELNSFCSLEEPSMDSEQEVVIEDDKSLKVVKELSQRQGLLSPDPEIESNKDSDGSSTFNAEFKMFKRNYYQEKLHFEGTDAEVAKIAYEYVLAIQWICHYYYNGVQSWSWYYPYHYAPFLSDLCNVSKMKLKYEMGTPFLPYQQLLAVLPSASKECLPEPYWDLMCSEHSPIIDYYPLDFQCDLNGKQQEWEAVVLIPFINEERLLDAMAPCARKCMKEESARNRHSGCLLYTYDQNLDYHVKTSLPGTFPDLVHCKASCEVIPLHSWSTEDTSLFTKGLLGGCRLSVFYPGFPTLYHLPHKAYLKKQSVKVFQMPSKNDNMILQIASPGENGNAGDGEGQAYRKGETLEDIAKNLLGTSVYVNWPHMEEAKAVAVSDGSVKFEVTEHIHAGGTKGSKHKLQRKTLTDKERRTFDVDIESVKESYLSRRGINVGRTDFVIYAQPLLGRKYVCGVQGQITLEKQWATQARAYVLQATVKDISVKDPTFQQFKGIEQLFPTDSIVFMLGHPFYGSQGKVLGISHGMASIEFKNPCEPDIEYVIRQRHRLSSRYYAGWELASRVGVSGYMVSRITGTIYVFYPTTRKWQLGLNLRFSRENSGVAGYTRVDNREWSYSEAVEVILREYMEKFPEILKYLQYALKKNEDQFDAEQMVGKGKDVIARLQQVSSWLKNLDCYGGDRVSEYSDMLETRVIDAVVEKVEEAKKKKDPEPAQITIPPHLLYRPLSHQGTLIPDKTAQHRLLDRVVNVRDGYTVPLGMRGTIIGIHRQPGQDVLFEVIFDEEFLGGLNFGGRCPQRRGYRMPECAIINLFYGKRAEMKDQKPTAVVRPQNKYASRTREAWSAPAHQNQRGSGPRYSHPNQDQTYRSRARPPTLQETNQANITLMQRPQAGRETKPVQSQPNMFDALWNTLKDQNRNSVNSSSSNIPTARPGHANSGMKLKGPSQQSKTSVKTQSADPVQTASATKAPSSTSKASASASRSNASPSKTAAPSTTKSVMKDPTSTALTKNAAQSKQCQHFPHSQNMNTFNLTSLSQAAKSLPKVQVSESADNTSNLQPENTAITSAASASSPHTISKRESGVEIRTKEPIFKKKDAAGKNDVEHLNQLFKSIKVSQPHAPPINPKLAFTPTESVHTVPSIAQSTVRVGDRPMQNFTPPQRMMGHYPPQNRFQPPPPPFAHPSRPYDQRWSRPPRGFPRPPGQYSTSMYPPNLPPQQFNNNLRQRPYMHGMRPLTYTHPSFLSTSEPSGPYRVPPPGGAPPHPAVAALFYKSVSQHDAGPQNTAAQQHRQHIPSNKEGTQKLCEMLNKERENEDASSSKWSTGEDDHDHVEDVEDSSEMMKQVEDKLINKCENMSLKDTVSDGDSEKDEEEYMERSTSVEDEKTNIIKKQTKVDELMALCSQCSMMPPIYTYFTAGDEQVVSTVQLWNGVRFSSHPQLNRDKAMEEAAGQAIGYLKNEIKDKRPVSTSPPSSLPYFVPVQNVIQPQYYGAAQPGYAPPVTFMQGQPQTYFVPSVAPGQIPFSLMTPTPVVSLPPEYQHTGFMPAYRYDAATYNPYLVRLHASPTRQPKMAPGYHHPAGPPQPVLWNPSRHVVTPDSYHVQDMANVEKRVTTQYKISDTPYIPSETREENPKVIDITGPTPAEAKAEEGAKKSSPHNKSRRSKKEEKTSRKQDGGDSRGKSSSKRPNASKAKLAISFDKDNAKQ